MIVLFLFGKLLDPSFISLGLLLKAMSEARGFFLKGLNEFAYVHIFEI